MQTRREAMFSGIAAAVAALWPWKVKADLFSDCSWSCPGTKRMVIERKAYLLRYQMHHVPRLGDAYPHDAEYRCYASEVVRRACDGKYFVRVKYEKT